jgi:hypothetical protein
MNQTLTKEQQFIEQMTKANNATRKQINAAMKASTPGSANYLRAVESLSNLAARERNEIIKLGLMPSDLSVATAISYHYVSHVPGVFDSRDAALAAVAKRDAGVADGAAISQADEEIRESLEEEFYESTKNENQNSSTEGDDNE